MDTFKRMAGPWLLKITKILFNKRFQTIKFRSFRQGRKIFRGQGMKKDEKYFLKIDADKKNIRFSLCVMLSSMRRGLLLSVIEVQS